MISVKDIQKLDKYSISEIEDVIEAWEDIRMEINRQLPEKPDLEDYEKAAAEIIKNEYWSESKVLSIMRLMKAEHKKYIVGE